MQARRLPADELGIFALMAEALAMRPLGHDDFDHRDRAAKPAVAREKPARPGVFERFDRWLWLKNQRSLEAHLGRASDVHDLEARIRAIERGVFYRDY